MSALDVSVQAGILALLEKLRERLRLTMLFITHDLPVAVTRRGGIGEQGRTAQMFAGLQHEYTRAPLDSIPARHWTPPLLAGAA